MSELLIVLIKYCLIGRYTERLGHPIVEVEETVGALRRRRHSPIYCSKWSIKGSRRHSKGPSKVH